MNELRTPVRIALLASFSLLLFILEGLIPLPMPVPGAKLGLAAVVTLVALYTLPHMRDAFAVLVLRILLASFFGGGLAPMLYSLAGGLGSFAVMALLKEHTRRLSIVGISAAGGLMHNICQLAVAAVVMRTEVLFYYAPLLGFLGILTGVGIGLLAREILQNFSTG